MLRTAAETAARPHLRSARTVFYMLTLSVLTVAAVILTCVRAMSRRCHSRLLLSRPETLPRYVLPHYRPTTTTVSRLQHNLYVGTCVFHLTNSFAL